MKSVFLKGGLVVIMLLSVANIFAQIHYGFMFGPNVASLRGSSVQNAKPILTFNFSGSADFNLQDVIKNNFGKHLSVQLEGGVSQKGVRLDFKRYNLATVDKTDFIDLGSQRVRATYLTMPVLFKYSFKELNSRSNPYVYMGSYLGGLLLLQVGKHTLRDENGIPDDELRLYKNDYSGVDYGFIFGTGFSQKIGGEKTLWAVTGDVRYVLGMRQMGRESTAADLRGLISDVKNNTLEISFGVRYELRREDPFQ